MLVNKYYDLSVKYLRHRSVLSADDLEYAASKIKAMKDERLHDIFLDLISWSAEDGKVAETLIQMAANTLKHYPPQTVKHINYVLSLQHALKDLEL